MNEQRNARHCDRPMLRRPNARDVGRIMAIVGDWEVVRRLGRVPHPYHETDARFFLDTVVPKEWVWAITLRESRELVGMVWSIPEADADSAELGYYVARDHWGNSIAQGNRLNPPLLPATGKHVPSAIHKGFKHGGSRRGRRGHGVRLKGASREAQFILLRGLAVLACFLRAKSLADVPPPRSPQWKTKGEPAKSDAGAFKRLSCGIAMEAAGSVVHHGIHSLGLHRIRSGHFVDNPASGRGFCPCDWRKNLDVRNSRLRECSPSQPPGRVLMFHATYWPSSATDRTRDADTLYRNTAPDRP